MKVPNTPAVHNNLSNRHYLSLTILTAATLLCSCQTSTITAHSSGNTEDSKASAIAEKVGDFSKSHSDRFTLDIRTMTEQKKGIAVCYAATKNSRNQLEKVVSHALKNDGYVGGRYNSKDKIYYFDSCRLFPEDSVKEAIRFGKENGQKSVFILSSSTEKPVYSVYSANVFLVMYDTETGKQPLLKAIKDYKCEIIYDYNIINGMAIKKPDNKTLEETMQHFKTVKGVLSVEYDHIIQLDDPVKKTFDIK